MRPHMLHRGAPRHGATHAANGARATHLQPISARAGCRCTGKEGCRGLRTNAQPLLRARPRNAVARKSSSAPRRGC
eukprot:9083947-Alexandrium_andersonii.AAC.1